MKKRNKRLLLAIGTIISLMVVVGFLYVYLSDPLRVDGVTTYNNEQKQIILSVINEGQGNLHLKRVEVNGDHAPQKAELGISYTLQLVLGGIESSPQAAFMAIDQQPITPARKAKDNQDIVKKRLSKPVFYGIRITNGSNVSDVTVTYSYFGLTKSKRIDITT
ncbi:hypothetical protein [Paenibacillus mendelii]|uniref:DUF5067 domain-containing protein n=1 Tax=Paenibacillus mendelii TaxID=206163 RepID=A0ABV6JG13_9BACL|nr:hypothetical protein [Paenibacillus mendelii]MCQ6557526.1 hypothetical protein [Paenibacillus mendelii]